MDAKVNGAHLPWVKWWLADWIGDTNLRFCSLAARGLWADMRCVMHQATPYGYLMQGGQPLDAERLARLVGADHSHVEQLLAELEKNGVFKRNEDGVIFDRTLVRADHLRTVRAAAGSAGGKKTAKKKG